MALGSETVTYSGSGLVFNNTYGSGVSATFRDEILAAENYLQSLFTNACTVNCNFDLQSLSPSYSAENFYNPVHVSYSSFVAALNSHAMTPTALAAAASLSNLSDPSNGAGFDVSVGEARILGLAGAGTGTDDTVILNSTYWTAAALQNYPGDAEGVIEHELTEGIMGRVGELGVAGSTHWAPMDLFRYTASGQRDFTGGRDGQPTYFSVDGSNVDTGLQYHNSVNSAGRYDHSDLADWNAVGADANAHDPFGPGGPGSGDPGTLSATDITVMEALGWSTLTAQYADLNGDGKADVIYQGQDNQFWVSLSTGSSFTAPQQWAQYHGPFMSWAAQYADLNGDGNTDLIYQGPHNGFWVSLSTGSGFAAPERWVRLCGPSYAGGAQYADVNGDGKADLIYQGPYNGYWLSLSTGSGFTTPQPWAGGSGFAPAQSSASSAGSADAAAANGSPASVADGGSLQFNQPIGFSDTVAGINEQTPLSPAPLQPSGFSDTVAGINAQTPLGPAPSQPSGLSDTVAGIYGQTSPGPPPAWAATAQTLTDPGTASLIQSDSQPPPNIALLGNYIASLSPLSSASNNGPTVVGPDYSNQPALLTHPLNA